MNVWNLLFPVQTQCAFCERKAPNGLICRLCEKDIQRIEGPLCTCCGKPMAMEGSCEDCIARPQTYFVCNRSAVRYNTKMKDIMSLYKFRGQESLADVLAEWLEQAYQAYYAEISLDAITFVPIHEQRLRERGFNQAEQLALRLSRKTKLPLVSLLRRTRVTDKQSKKHRTERLAALRDAFEWQTGLEPIQKVLLVDDVYTTGSTVNECARVLAEQGIIVYGLTVAR